MHTSVTNELLRLELWAMLSGKSANYSGSTGESGAGAADHDNNCETTIAKKIKFTEDTVEPSEIHETSTQSRSVDESGNFRTTSSPNASGRKEDKNLRYVHDSTVRSISNKIFKLGERGSGLRSRGKVQDFYELRDECLDNCRLFEDANFPPDNSSLYYSQRSHKVYEWMRPHEICSKPQLFTEGYSRFDVKQGKLGDCWLLAAAANLTFSGRLFSQVVPGDQSFDDKYAGIFHFRFWQYGRWIDVVIDDKLPTDAGKLAYLSSTNENEFWSALLEKAYAKLHGSYEALRGGTACEAMQDFTGGFTEIYKLNNTEVERFRKIVLNAYERASLIGCALGRHHYVSGTKTHDGLIRGHVYSITGVKYVNINTSNTTEKILLLRIRNPWAKDEWNGPWSDRSPEWRSISEREQEELGLTFVDDGEFWMSFNDIKSHFDQIHICNLTPDSLTEEELQEGHKKRWEVSFYEGEWVHSVTAGGRRELETYQNNPQYRMTLSDVDEGDDDGKCTLIVALIQKNRRSQRNKGFKTLKIGFAIYYLPDSDNTPKPLDLQFFKSNEPKASSNFAYLREVSCRFKLPPGMYCIIPSTCDQNQAGEFLLRVFSEQKNNLKENDEDIYVGDIDVRVKNVEPTPEDNKQTVRIYELFSKLAGDDDEVDWRKLKELLEDGMRLETENRGFSKDVCRSMIAMLDVDHSGKLGHDEFETLWSYIKNWKTIFSLYDKNNCAILDCFQLRRALNSAGYHINNRILNALVRRYADSNGTLQLDKFFMCAVKLQTMIDTFKKKDPMNSNKATFTLDEWIESTLYF